MMLARAIMAAAAVLILAATVQATATMEEQRKIEGLIRHVESMTDAKFIRNGHTYSSKTAAWFLRKKWEANRNKVATARDFIEQIATKSSTSGKAYSIMLKDGRLVMCADYLKDVLRLSPP